MSASTGTNAPLVVGMVLVNCPACAEAMPVDVRVESVGTKGGSYLIVDFQTETPRHQCPGRRS